MSGDGESREDLRHSGEGYLVALREKYGGAPEIALFENVWDFFKIKHGLGLSARIARERLAAATRERREEKGRFLVACLGPLGAGKTQLARHLAHNLSASFSEEVYQENPFVSASYSAQSKGVAFRSQLYFLFSDVRKLIIDQASEKGNGRWVRDTHPFSDALVFCQWMVQSGEINEQESEIYTRTWRLIEDVIPNPDLMVVLRPIRVEALAAGIADRARDCGGEAGKRAYELGLGQKDLQLFIDTTDRATSFLEELGAKVLVLQIDPRRVYEDGDLKYAIGYEIRGRLGILGELINPAPKQTVADILKLLVGQRGRLILLHSPTMYTGRSEVIRRLKKELGPKMAVFRPALSIRPEFDESQSVMVTRDRNRVDVITVGRRGDLKSNDIKKILVEIDKREITPEQVPVLAIDEGQLFLGSKGEEVIAVLEELTRRGFDIVFVGLDYTFKGHWFSYMGRLLEWADKQAKNVYIRGVNTKCAYCDSLAMCTRRVPKTGRIGSYDGPDIEIGDSYEPVCDQGHLACEGRPSGLVKPALPSDKWPV